MRGRLQKMIVLLLCAALFSTQAGLQSVLAVERDTQQETTASDDMDGQESVSDNMDAGENVPDDAEDIGSKESVSENAGTQEGVSDNALAGESVSDNASEEITVSDNTGIKGSVSGQDVEEQTGADKIYNTSNEAGAYLRSQMVMRKEKVIIPVASWLADEEKADEIVTEAIRYTEDCSGKEGDTLRWGAWDEDFKITPNGSSYLITYTLGYTTTYEQEEQLDEALARAAEELQLEGKSDYQKARLIHDYICTHVEKMGCENREDEGSAYEALCVGKTDCWGYSFLFYRMCQDAGLSSRFLWGTGKDETGEHVNHAWNYVRIGEYYYNVDCVWDIQDEGVKHDWFLLCNEDFQNHTITEGIAGGFSEYPMSPVSYDKAGEAYKITYVLNGGKNSEENPEAYYEEQGAVLYDAEREGYYFVGWYRDKECTDEVTEIPAGSVGDITLYAKWEEVLQSGGIPAVKMTPSNDNVIMGFSGSYYTESAEKILKRLNEIRKEACKKGYKNPNSGKPLTEADYKPLQWSAGLEAIARQRAAEASVKQAHERPNGKSCFTAVTVRGNTSWAENLAWNYSGLMEGIEQWYGEKNDWINNTGKQTGHYTSIINPSYLSVGLGAFRLSSGGWYAVAQEFGYGVPDDTTKSNVTGSCIQYMEVASAAVTKLKFESTDSLYIRTGDSRKLPALKVSAKFKDYYGTEISYSGPFRQGGTWSSSDESVATAKNDGTVTAKGVGEAEICITSGKASAKCTVITADTDILNRYSSDHLAYIPDYPIYGYPYTGKAQKPEVIVLDKSGNRLSPDTDYTVKYTKNVNVGQAKLTIRGKGQKKSEVGTKTIAFSICPAELNETFERSHIKDKIYTAKKQKPSVKVQMKMLDGKRKTLKAKKDYTLSYEQNIESGTAHVLITGKGNFTGSIATTFEIKKKPINKGIKVSKLTTMTYDGSPQCPKPQLKFGKTVMEEGRDYTISYENNTERGKAQIIFIGTGNYEGTLTKYFKII